MLLDIEYILNVNFVSFFDILGVGYKWKIVVKENFCLVWEMWKEIVVNNCVGEICRFSKIGEGG